MLAREVNFIKLSYFLNYTCKTVDVNPSYLRFIQLTIKKIMFKPYKLSYFRSPLFVHPHAQFLAFNHRIQNKKKKITKG